MPYFSRLTDIVTCNLSSILADADDQQAALEEIIFEMTEGVAGAERSVKTAGTNVSRIEVEIGEQQAEISAWLAGAQEALANGNEADARQALERKHEVEDLIAGLEQQLEAAISTRDHLRTMLNALQARLADAQRRLRQMKGSSEVTADETVTAIKSPQQVIPVSDKQSRVEAELASLRQQLDSNR